MTYRYFVSYNVITSGKSLFSRNELRRYRQIQSMIDIEEMEELIALGLGSSSYGKPLVTIINFILLGTDEEEPQP